MLSDERQVLPWEYGRMFGMRLTSHYIRVTARGIQFSTSSALSSLRNVSSLGWESTSLCLPAPDALCREGPGLLFFPDAVVDVPYDFAQIPPNSVLARFPNGSSCQRRASRRVLNPTDTQYEVSLCDLLDSNLDVLLDCHNNQLHWRRDGTTAVEYLFISLMCVYLMSCISANVVKIATPLRVTRGDLAILLVNLAYLLVNFFFSNLRFLVTNHDLVLFWLLWAYVCLETALLGRMWRWQRSAIAPAGQGEPGGVEERGRMGGISVYTAVLVMLTMRVHYSFDNPYLHILTAMFGTRTFQKVSRLRPAADVHTLAVLYDAVCFCGLLAIGVGAAADTDFDAVLTQLIFAVISLLLATAIDLRS